MLFRGLRLGERALFGEFARQGFALKEQRADRDVKAVRDFQENVKLGVCGAAFDLAQREPIDADHEGELFLFEVRLRASHTDCGAQSFFEVAVHGA